MKVRYLREHIPQWVRVPFETIHEGEIMKDLKGKYYPNGAPYFRDYWVKRGANLVPVHELNKHKKWVGYFLSDSILVGMTALVER